MILSTWSCDFVVCKLHAILLTDLLRPNFNFIAIVEIDVPSKEFRSKIISKESPLTAFITSSIDSVVKRYPQCTFPTDIMSRNL